MVGTEDSAASQGFPWVLPPEDSVYIAYKSKKNEHRRTESGHAKRRKVPPARARASRAVTLATDLSTRPMIDSAQ